MKSVANRRIVRAVLLVVFTLGSHGSLHARDDKELAPNVRDIIANASRAAPQDPSEQRRRELLRELYMARNFSPLWTHDGVLTAQALELIQILRNADKYGLRSQDYPVSFDAGPQAGQLNCATPPLPFAAAFDVELSASALRFLTHLHFGRVDPHAVGFNLDISRAPLDLRALLERLAVASSVQEVIASDEPQFYHYQLLKQALVRYELLAAGMADATPSERATAPFAPRVRQIELTLERWRWLPAFTNPPIIVNIPQFRLFAFKSTVDRKSEILQMDVIVGRTYPSLRTPVFAADMKYVIFRPYWDVPSSITQREMLPAIRRNPDYLRREHLEIVRGSSDSAAVLPPTPENLSALASRQLRLRQQPGADNALGLIKFMLPNAHNVYLHSTPTPQLFKQSRRAFSHGCIRVSDPVALAAFVLRSATGIWTQETIEKAMNDSATRRVTLTTTIPVLILYGTALATEDGAVMFFDDIYDYDRKLEILLHLPPVTEG